MAQSVKHPTLGFCSGRNLEVVISNPRAGSALRAELA